MSSVRISFSQKDIDVMLDIFKHVEDHVTWMTEVFEGIQ